MARVISDGTITVFEFPDAATAANASTCRFMISGLMWMQHQGVFELFENWRQIALCFGLFSLLSIALIKWVFQRPGEDNPDINEY